MKLPLIKSVMLVGSYFAISVGISGVDKANTKVPESVAKTPDGLPSTQANTSASTKINTQIVSVPSSQPNNGNVVVSNKVDAPTTPQTTLKQSAAWPLAQKAFKCAKQFGLRKTDAMVVIDYSLPSTKKRFWVVEPSTGKVLYREYVAHGVNSGDVKSNKFSNINMSKQSSLGVFYTAETYVGKHGYSLRLDGQELGVNDLARRRAIVIHGAKYVNDAFIKKFGRLGRSWGCPALDNGVSKAVIDKIKGGRMVFAYYPDEQWQKGSDFLTCK